MANPDGGGAARVKARERSIRALLKDYVYDRGGVEYGVALWEIADGDGHPDGHAEVIALTAAPLEPSDTLVPLSIRLSPSNDLDRARLFAAVDQALAAALQERAGD